MHARIITAAIFTGVAIFAVVVCLPASPAYPLNPQRDSGLFLYFGSQILEGDILYRDLWDHKPPAIFYVNALALAAGGSSWWSVWFAEVLFVSFAAWCAYRVCARYGRLPAAIASVAWLSASGPLAIGWNQTEGYALAMQFAAYGLWNGRRPSELRRWHWLALGITGAISVFFKPNIIGTWVAIFAVLSMIPGERRSVARGAGLAMLGAASVAAPLILHLHLNDALIPAIDQNVYYSSIYVGGTSAAARINAAVHGLKLVALYGGGLAFVALAAVPLARRRSGAPLDLLVMTAGIDLVLELAAAALSGRTYEHYYLCLLPPVAILTAAALAALRSLVPGAPRTRALVLVLCSLLALFGGLTRVRTALADHQPKAGALFRETAVELVENSTSREDPVLVWGAEAAVNFLAERRTPTRYAQLFPLQTTGYTTAAMIGEFETDLRRSPPALILDTSPREPLFMPIARPLRERWRPQPAYTPLPELERVTRWIESNYELRGLLMPNGWLVWERRDHRSSLRSRGGPAPRGG